MPVIKPYPRIIQHGINDKSQRTVPLTSEEFPQHLPAMFLLSQRSEAVTFGTGKHIDTVYGRDTLNPKSDYYTHQTKFAETIIGESNQIMVVPIKMPGAKKAGVRIAVEVIATTEVNKDDQSKTNKTRLIWHALEIDEQEPFTQGNIKVNYRDGSTTTALGNDRLAVLIDENDEEYFMSSMLVPIIDLQVDYRGEYGSRLGVVLEAPSDGDTIPTDSAMAERLNSFIYRMRLVERRSKNSITSSPIRNIYSGVFSDFVLKPHAIDPQTNIMLSFGDVLTRNYTSSTEDGTPITAPFHTPAIYQDNVEMIAMMIAKGHTVTGQTVGGQTKNFVIKGIYDSEEQARQNLYKVNILTARDVSGKQYPNATTKGSYTFGGLELGSETVIYAKGGTDGFPVNNAGLVDKTETLRLFDEAVRDWCANFNELNPLFDSAKYPFNFVWDSGFSLDTKRAMGRLVGAHKRMIPMLSTQVLYDYKDAKKDKFVSQQQNTAEQELAMAVQLSALLKLYPESELYGTKTCRAGIIMHSGHLADGSYHGLLPFSLSIAKRIAAYCGASNGYWKSAKAIDHESNRIDTMFEADSLNNTYLPPRVYDKLWNANVMYVQNFDRSSVYNPAYQTVYDDSTSILDSLLVVIAASYIQRVGEIVFREIVGDGKYGKLQFLEESNRRISKLTENRFDSRFVVVPETFYTEADELRGYSWSTNVSLYAEPTKLVNQFTVESYRMEDYNR